MLMVVQSSSELQSKHTCIFRPESTVFCMKLGSMLYFCDANRISFRFITVKISSSYFKYCNIVAHNSNKIDCGDT